eukprot:538672-Amphidinium_carterae.1
MTDMFCCEAPAFFVYLTLLQSTWDMAPASCGKAVRILTPSDVSRCLDPKGFGLDRVSSSDSRVASRLSTIASPLPTNALCIVLGTGGLLLALRCLSEGCKGGHTLAPAEATTSLLEHPHLNVSPSKRRTTPSESYAGDPGDVTSFETTPAGGVDLKLLLGVGRFGETWKALLVTADGTGQATEVVAKSLRPEDFSAQEALVLYERMVKIMELPGGVPYPYLVRMLQYEAERRSMSNESAHGI